MAENLGTGVSYVSDSAGYAYDTVVFQKGKPPLDTELNLLQDIRRELSARDLNSMPSGWLTFRPYKTSPLLSSQFYSQDPTVPIPEFALVNGMPVFITNTGTQQNNVNIIDLGTPPPTGNEVNGVYLEVWRALLNTSSDQNRPSSTTIIDSINDLDAADANIAWAIGENGLILATTNAGATWTIQPISSKRNLNGVSFFNNTIGWVVGDNGTIARTASGGQSWTLLTSGVTENLKGIFALTQSQAWIVGTSGTLLNSTNGINWVPQTSGVTADLNAIHFYNSTVGWIAGNNGTILKTTDGGQTWRPLVSGTTNNLNSIFFLDLNFGFAVGNNGTLLQSSNGGATWVAQSSGVTVDLTDVVMLANNCINDSITFVTGKIGTVLRSGDLGQTWVKQTSGTSYDLNAVNFIDLNIGWVAGQFSTIRYTLNGGTTWTAQTSDVLIRKLQRVFKEGNTGTLVYLADNIIHPDANIETTERVQIQYCIRVAPNVDPFNYPDAGLGSQVITGLGPNLTGSFPFVNMGATTGDYGLYQAQCPNTVDGFCWAIPMAFVNRRNTTPYNSSSNTNGQNVSGSAIRPDLLTAYNVVDADVLDARRKIVIPSIDELLNTNFEALMNNSLRTRFSRNIDGGDRYGTELLQLDRIGGTNANGGTDLGLSLSQFFGAPYNGRISSTVTVATYTHIIAAPISVPASYTFPNVSGIIYHPNPAHYKAVYVSSNNLYNGKPIPGYFKGIGTNAPIFVFSSRANTTTQDSGLSRYQLSADQITHNNYSLIDVPTSPQLIKNFSNNSQQEFYYQGILENSPGKVIEEWASGISGENNYALAVPGKNVTDASLELRASTVELHYFLTLTKAATSGSMGIDPGNPNLLLIDPTKFGPNSPPYVIYTISKVNNVTGGFSYKLKNTGVTTSVVTIETISGYSFVPGTLIEIVGMVMSQAKDFFVRNGATVNFSAPQKAFGSFCRSELLTGTMASGASSIYLSASDGNILGVSTAETINDLTQQIAWLDLGLGAQFYPVSVTIVPNSSTIFVQFTSTPGIIPVPGLLTGTVTIQVLIANTALPNQLTDDGVLIGYYYAPMQTESELPTTLTISMVTKPNVMCVSDLGTGGTLLDAEPYDNPLINIPVVDNSITNDNSFYNVEPIRFSNFSITGGFAQLPVYVPANFQGDLILSAPASDALSRHFYGSVSSDFSFEAEGLILGSQRKIFVAAIARITNATDTRFVQGEYVLMIVSRTAYLNVENRVGFKNGDLSSVAIYRLPNKPLSRI